MAVSSLPERRFTDVNEAFLSTLGCSREEVLGQTSEELGLFVEPEQQRAVAEQLRAQGRVADRELKVRRKDGAILDGLFSGEIIESQGRQYFLTVMSDQTERRRAEEALQESEALYRSIMSASPDDIGVTDLEGRLRMVSPAGLTMFGYEREEEMLGRSFSECLVPEDRERAQANVALRLQGALRGPGEYRGLRADGSAFAIEVNGELIRDADEQPTGMVFIIRDITARKEAEQNALLFAQAQTELDERKQAEEALALSAAQLREQLHETVKAMGAIVGLRDPCMAAHERRVAALAAAIAVELGLGEEAREGLAFAGEVHDTGKVAVPAEILSKPGALSDMEYALITQHPEAGRELLGAIHFRQPVAEIVAQHHERLNGSGYPDGLRGDEIMLEARILAVADVVEAMASHRPYRPTLGLEAALAEVRGGAGTRYDAGVVAACERAFAAGFVFDTPD